MEKVLNLCKEGFSVYIASVIHCWLLRRSDKIRLKSILVMPDRKRYVLIYREVTAAEVANYAHRKESKPEIKNENGLLILQSVN